MEFEMVSISRETIKPSSPTPPHLKTFKISLIDNLMPSTFYIPFITFYTLNKQDYSPHDLTNSLKHSLSRTLTRFYPLAGRFDEQDFTVCCNDKGMLFSTTRVKCGLSQLLEHSKINLFYKFILPSPPVCDNPLDGPSQMGFQHNVFACGGVALCVYFSHKIIDATTIAAFMKCWAGINAKGSRPDQVVVQQCFPVAALFPHREVAANVSFTAESSLLDEPKGIIKRFVCRWCCYICPKGKSC